jgi:hypothetical protein
MNELDLIRLLSQSDTFLLTMYLSVTGIFASSNKETSPTRLVNAGTVKFNISIIHIKGYSQNLDCSVKGCSSVHKGYSTLTL